MTRSFVLADASIIACFDYTSMIWVLVLGVLFLGEFPSPTVLMGASIVTAAGILVIVGERARRLR
jgi:drug/metabolite transporter (DMT)-like permease